MLYFQTVQPETISIIIPVYNEVHGIQKTLENLSELPSAIAREIIVSDGHPSGTTLKQIHQNNITKVLSSKGRGTQMNTGAAVAKGDILLFLHADTLLPRNAFELIVNACRNSPMATGAFGLRIQSRKSIYRLIEWVASQRSRLTRIPYGDQAIFIQTPLFRKVGGYAEIPLMEDIELMRRIKKVGGDVSILPAKIQTSPRRWEKEGLVYCTLRNWLLVCLYLSGVSPRFLERFYR